MLYRTHRQALDSHRSFASWIECVIVKVTLRDGREFYRTYEFNQYQHKCKRCRKAEQERYRGLHAKLPSTGHVCETCGNPYAGFVGRTHIINRAGQHEMIRDSWARSGRLH
jgi:hypothetical protein